MGIISSERERKKKVDKSDKEGINSQIWIRLVVGIAGALSCSGHAEVNLWDFLSHGRANTWRLESTGHGRCWEIEDPGKGLAPRDPLQGGLTVTLASVAEPAIPETEQEQGNQRTRSFPRTLPQVVLHTTSVGSDDASPSTITSDKTQGLTGVLVSFRLLYPLPHVGWLKTQPLGQIPLPPSSGSCWRPTPPGLCCITPIPPSIPTSMVLFFLGQSSLYQSLIRTPGT